MDHKYIQGTCMQMCPEEEIILRQKENLLHIFEMVPNTANSSKPVADKKRTVKSFARSAAGKEPRAKDIRPPDVLLKTVSYLLKDVINNEKVLWNVTYDFLMDRLRAVRQDLIIQNATPAHYITILQPIIRFHAFASYKLCEEPVHIFDPHLNKTHLQECLKRLLVCYDELCEKQETNEFLKEHRPQFEAMYVLLNLGDSIAIMRCLSLNKVWRTELVQLSLQISLAYRRNNFVRVCMLVPELPALLMAVAMMHQKQLQRNALGIMSLAYNNKLLTFPVDSLKKLLIFNSDDEVINDCKYYNLEVKDFKVRFLRSSFSSTKPVVPTKRSDYLDKKFATKNISSWVLFGE